MSCIYLITNALTLDAHSRSGIRQRRPPFWPTNSFCSASPALEIPNEATKLVFELRADKPNTFVLGLGNYYAEVKLSGGDEVQRIELSPADFLHNYQRGSGPVAIADWSEIWQSKLYLGPSFAFKKLKDAEGEESLIGRRLQRKAA